MTCSNCGKNIPFVGNVCPHCHADKSHDKLSASIQQFWGVVGLIAGGLIGWATNRAVGMFWSGMTGAVAGVIVGSLLTPKKQQHPNSEIPEAPPERIPAGGQLPVPNAQPPAPEQEAALLASGEYRRCSQCAEIIRSAAKVCRFCGADVDR